MRHTDLYLDSHLSKVSRDHSTSEHGELSLLGMDVEYVIFIYLPFDRVQWFLCFAFTVLMGFCTYIRLYFQDKFLGVECLDLNGVPI